MRSGVWQIADGGPRRVDESNVDLEAQLEQWIESDPGLVQTGLVIVARQMAVEGGFLDLLALDPQGRWVIIEIKRGQLRRETIAQALDYAACLAEMSADVLRSKIRAYLAARGTTIEALLRERGAEDALDSRDAVLTIVGTSRAPGLERIVSYWAEHSDVPISVVTFGVFELSDGQRLLVRELTEDDTAANRKPERQKETRTPEELFALARELGYGDEFKAVYDTALEHGLYARVYRKSIMFTPPDRRNRMLFTIWAARRGNGLKMYVDPEPFAEFCPVARSRVEEILGLPSWGWQGMDRPAIGKFTQDLRRIMGEAASG